MKSIVSWLLVFFMAIFWVFRIIVTLSAQYGSDVGGFQVFDNTTEIILLFVTLLCSVLIVKRVIWGGLIYLGGYGWYFGKYLIQNFIPGLTSAEGVDPIVMQNSFIAILGLILGLSIVIDIAVSRVKLKHFTDNKTDWYFDTDKYDRKMDERADKNQYRTL